MSLLLNKCKSSGRLSTSHETSSRPSSTSTRIRQNHSASTQRPFTLQMPGLVLLPLSTILVPGTNTAENTCLPGPQCYSSRSRGPSRP